MPAKLRANMAECSSTGSKHMNKRFNPTKTDLNHRCYRSENNNMGLLYLWRQWQSLVCLWSQEKVLFIPSSARVSLLHLLLLAGLIASLLNTVCLPEGLLHCQIKHTHSLKNSFKSKLQLQTCSYNLIPCWIDQNESVCVAGCPYPLFVGYQTKVMHWNSYETCVIKVVCRAKTAV